MMDRGASELNFLVGDEGAENGRWGDYVFNQDGVSEVWLLDLPLS